MSKQNLPEKINPFRLAEAGALLRRSLFIKDMQRLKMSLANDGGQVEVQIQFGIDQQGIRFLRGHLETTLMLQCQRCNEAFVYEIKCDFLSGVTKTEEAAKDLPSAYEAVLVDENSMLVVRDLIEDELIIGLPIVPMHDQKDCKVELKKIQLGLDQGSERDDSNPFKVIDILRSKKS